MISVVEAKKIIRENIHSLPTTKTSLYDAATWTLAEDVYAITDIPGFNQSSVDGYAFAFDDWKRNKLLTIKGEIPAGEESLISLSSGQAIRIFTGAPVPIGADTVVMQEKISISNGQLHIEDSHLLKGNAIRLKGSEIKSRELALSKGTCLTPAAIGFLASIGIAQVSINSIPTISIIVTGNELQQPGQVLLHGQVYESNSITLVTALQQLNLKDVQIYFANDDLKSLTTILKDSLANSDLVLLTGGISVGDYDFVLEATRVCGVEKLFHKVKQKPGKPLFFGKKGNQFVFGLPGNPSSVITCFYEYVIPALQLLNSSIKGLQIINAPLGNVYNKAVGLSHFLKGTYDGVRVTFLNAQESYRLSSFAKANCLIFIPEETTSHHEDESVEIHLLPA